MSKVLIGRTQHGAGLFECQDCGSLSAVYADTPCAMCRQLKLLRDQINSAQWRPS